MIMSEKLTTDAIIEVFEGMAGSVGDAKEKTEAM